VEGIAIFVEWRSAFQEYFDFIIHSPYMPCKLIEDSIHRQRYQFKRI